MLYMCFSAVNKFTYYLQWWLFVYFSLWLECYTMCSFFLVYEIHLENVLLKLLQYVFIVFYFSIWYFF